MAEQAMEMLKRARFWFTQLTLIQALCLWEMPEPSMSRYDRTGRRGDGYPDRRGSNPEATVGYWLEMARNGKHPFVAEAGKLAVEALKTGHPERFLWIDESGIVSSVGSRAALATKEWKHDLWIPPSAGWAALDPRALQLVADVLLLLNLVERGEGPGDVEQRLRRVEGSDLPPCFTRNRYSLDPKTTVGNMFRAPGSNCIDGCRHADHHDRQYAGHHARRVWRLPGWWVSVWPAGRLIRSCRCGARQHRIVRPTRLAVG